MVMTLVIMAIAAMVSATLASNDGYELCDTSATRLLTSY
jgi:hypothetical protein